MIIFDLETIPRRNLSEKILLYRSANLEFKEPKLGRLVDEEKIKAKLLETERHNSDLKKNFRNRDALDVDYAEVVAGGFMDETGKGKIYSQEKIREDELLDLIFDALGNDTGPMVGYNIKGYDIPLLKRCALHYGIRIPDYLFINDNIVDLMEILQEYRKIQPKKLNEYGMIYGYPVNMDFAQGSEVLKAFHDSDWEFIKKHLAQDLKITEYLFKMLHKTNQIYNPRIDKNYGKA